MEMIKDLVSQIDEMKEGTTESFTQLVQAQAQLEVINQFGFMPRAEYEAHKSVITAFNGFLIKQSSLLEELAEEVSEVAKELETNSHGKQMTEDEVKEVIDKFFKSLGLGK